MPLNCCAWSEQYHSAKYMSCTPFTDACVTVQCFLYTRAPGMPDDNHYAHPLDMVVNLVCTALTVWITLEGCSRIPNCRSHLSRHLQDMNTRKVVAIWHHEGSEYQVPRVNSNFHRGTIEQPWRTGPKPLDIVQVRCMKGIVLVGCQSAHAGMPKQGSTDICHALPCTAGGPFVADRRSSCTVAAVGSAGRLQLPGGAGPAPSWVGGDRM